MNNKPITHSLSFSTFIKGCGTFILVVAGLLLFIGVLWGTSRLLRRETIQTFPPADVTTQQVGDRLIVTLPQGSVEIEMVFVPAGEFAMGSESEPPIHQVYLDAFWIDRTEVTNAQFAAFVDTTGYLTFAEQEGTGLVETGQLEEIEGADWQYPQGPDSNIEQLANYPAVQISWYDAMAYCQWRGARLPTEAEWEKAARGIEGYIYPWGDEFDGTQMNFCDISCVNDYKNTMFDDKYARIAPVGSFPAGASPYGALDMVGNVAEWVADWFVDGYYADSPTENPLGPAEEDLWRTNFTGHAVAKIKVIRGGSWADNEPLGADMRDSNFPYHYTNTLGFRCASTP